MKLSAVSIMIFLVSSCTPKEDLDNDGVIQEVRSMFAEYEALVERDGLMAEFAFLDSTDDFFWVPPGYNSAISFDSIRTDVTANAQQMRSISLSWDSLRIVPLSRTTAAYTGVLIWESENVSGGTTRTRLLESGVVVKRSGTWKLLCGQTRNVEVY